jgi:cobalamin synthase
VPDLGKEGIVAEPWPGQEKEPRLRDVIRDPRTGLASYLAAAAVYTALILLGALNLLPYEAFVPLLLFTLLLSYHAGVQRGRYGK